MGYPVGLEQGGGAQRRSQSHSMALTSPRVPISRNVYQDKCCADALHRRIFLFGGVPSGTRTATTTTAACGRNREELLGPRSDFSKPCQGAAEKSANATRKTLTARFRCGSQPIGMSTKTNAVLMLCIGGFFIWRGAQWDSAPRHYFLLKKHVQALWRIVVPRGLHMLFCSALFLYCSQRFICCRICAISALE